jgi:hypothetical protein
MMMTGTIDFIPRPKLLYLYGDAGIEVLLKNLCLTCSLGLDMLLNISQQSRLNGHHWKEMTRGLAIVSWDYMR